jgi:hypothetical protein
MSGHHTPTDVGHRAATVISGPRVVLRRLLASVSHTCLWILVEVRSNEDEYSCENQESVSLHVSNVVQSTQHRLDNVTVIVIRSKRAALHHAK